MTPIAILIAIFLGYLIFILPLILIVFSKSLSGKKKIKWLISILLIPIVLNTIYSLFVHSIWIPHIPGILQISAWSIYLYFKIKYGSPNRKIIPKSILFILLISIAIFVVGTILNTFKQQESKLILNCVSEKIFMKNLEPNKLYLSLSYISETYSIYIGKL